MFRSGSVCVQFGAAYSSCRFQESALPGTYYWPGVQHGGDAEINFQIGMDESIVNIQLLELPGPALYLLAVMCFCRASTSQLAAICCKQQKQLELSN